MAISGGKQDDEADYEAFLHIVHLSDMHYRDESGASDLRMERGARQIAGHFRRCGAQRLSDWMLRKWHQGTAGQDSTAHERLCSFLTQFADNPHFSGVETWLLDTGDLSSLGDLGSLQNAVACLKEYQSILGASKLLTLYGNHDAWPGKFPLRASRKELHTHRTQIRSTKLFPSRWPVAPLSIPIPHCQSRVLLQGVSSVIDDRWLNARALGRVGSDPNWLPVRDGVHQLRQLAADTEQGWHADGSTRDFRILAVHHPIHYPPPRPGWTMHMKNDADVADALAAFGQKGRGKLAHLVLSGHTHETYPAWGELPAQVSAHVYSPLVAGQVQLVAGSQAQATYTEGGKGKKGEQALPQEFQILTFFAAPHNAHRQLVIERRVVRRTNNNGPYDLMKAGDGEVEAITLSY